MLSSSDRVFKSSQPNSYVTAAGIHLPRMLVQSGRRLLLVLLLISAWHEPPAFATDLNASWEYVVSGREEEDTVDRFLQRYHLGTDFTLEPTHALSAGGHLAYSRNEASGVGVNEVLTPSAELSLTNDIFIAGLAGTFSETRNPTSSDLETYTWEASLGSGWFREFWPTLRLYYGGSGSRTEDERIDTEEDLYGLDLNWALPGASLYYGFSKREGENHANETREDSTSHLGRMETGGIFWDRRLSLNLIQSVSHTSSDLSVGEGGRFDQDLQLPTFAVVGSDPGFLDHILDLTSSAFTSLTLSVNQAGHLGIRGVFDEEGEQQVDQLRLAVDSETASRIDAGLILLQDLQWALYASTDNLNWEPVPGRSGVEAIYASEDRRFEIDASSLPLPSRIYNYLKVVVVNRGLADVNFSSLRAIHFITASESLDQTTYTTDLNVGVRILPTLMATSTLNLTLGEDIKDRTVHTNLRWSPSPIVSPSLGFSESRRETSESPVLKDRSYSLTIPVFPLPTLNFTLGTSRIESYTGSRRISTSDVYSLNSTAALYPDLTANMSLSYTTGEIDEGTDGVKDRESLFGRLGLIARLSRKLTAEITNSYQKTLEPVGSTFAETALNVSYRPSEMLVARLIAIKNWEGESPYSIDLGINLALVRTARTRVNLQYRHVQNDTNTDTFGLLAGWDINRNLSLQSQGRYEFSDEEDAWYVSMRLHLRI